MTPYYLEANPEDPMRATMDIYGDAVRRVASEYDALFVDTQAAFARYGIISIHRCLHMIAYIQMLQAT